MHTLSAWPEDWVHRNSGRLSGLAYIACWQSGQRRLPAIWLTSLVSGLPRAICQQSGQRSMSPCVAE